MPAPVPEISIITPTWNTKPRFLSEAAASLLSQTLTNWEWCIVDDASTERAFYELFRELERDERIRVKKLNSKAGISGATNAGLEMAGGRFVCFLDHDDLLTPDALAKTVAAMDGKDAVYSDSDKVDDEGHHREPFHKPDWSPEYFRGVMYVGHLLCVRRNLALSIGGFDSRFDSVQDFEFMLRYSERTQRIGHIDEILYHWRATEGSVALNGNAKADIPKLQCEAVQQHLRRCGLRATAVPSPFPHRAWLYATTRQDHPRISVIIPTRDAPELLERCLNTLFGQTGYPDFEVLCMDNETTDERALRLMSLFPVLRVACPGPFNFSRVCNLGARIATGEYLVFLNNDIEVLFRDWINHMLYYAEQQDVGAVGAMLLYPDRTVQHAGVVLGCRGTADHVSRGWAGDLEGHAGSLACAREVSAVTAACMMVRRSLFESVGGFNEHFFTAYQDVDLCLKIMSAGKRNIYTPRACFIHHESASRGRRYDLVDRALLLDLWEPAIASGDRYYNRHLDEQACDYSLKPHAA